MPQLVELVLLPSEYHDTHIIRQKAAQQTGHRPDQISHVEILKSSLDARPKQPIFRVRVEVYTGAEEFSPEPAILPNIKPVDGKKKAIIVGAGPAGYFAALELLENGIKPIVFDRGKDVQSRRRDLRAIQQFGIVNPDSNYCFGEGGAGTYSDGKLYTRSVKRGDVHKVLKILVEHGAKSDILFEAHPHIGSNKLPGVVQNIRKTILHFGGEVYFGQRVIDFILKNGIMRGVITQAIEGDKGNQEWFADAVILAAGHSARDIYKLLHSKNISIESKSFALGVRVEHPQSLIDEIQYNKGRKRDDFLPPANYSLVCQIGARGVFSFCMCPGGLIVPSATSSGEIVVNGMSMSRRDSPFANSGIVASIEKEDLLPLWGKHGVFAAMEFQREIEQTLFQYGGDASQKAPALRLPDFVKEKISTTLPPSSYIPGLYPAPLFELLPSFIYKRLREGLGEFGKKMRGFYTTEANVAAPESRTSAPIRIPRDSLTLMHPHAWGFFPCGEGAGYAGGIVSAAIDGQNVAHHVVAFVKKR